MDQEPTNPFVRYVIWYPLSVVFSILEWLLTREYWMDRWWASGNLSKYCIALMVSYIYTALIFIVLALVIFVVSVAILIILGQTMWYLVAN